MSEQPSSGLLGQFLGDLSAIREKRNVSLDALRNATKVYPNVISQFEHDGLKDHPLFNSLYVRAFIRSYAKAVGIPAEEVLRAYDEALEGGYKRELAIEHLDLPIEEIEALRVAQEEAANAEPVFTVDKFEFDRDSKKDTAVSQMRSEMKIKNAAASGAAVTFIPKSEETASPLSSFVDGARASVQSFFKAGRQHVIVQWGLLAGGIGLGLFVILQLLSFQSNTAQPNTADNDDPQQPSVETTQQDVNSSAVVVPDSVAALPALDIAVEAPVVPVILGDSIPLHIVAFSGRLDPFRLKKDGDLRRPYWLDEGDTMVVYLKNRVTIEEDLQAMKILISGAAYPIYRTDSLAKVVINRDSIQAFLEPR